jgi:hypothetical protein
LISAQQSPYEVHRQTAIRMNELAGHIASPQDAQRLIDMIAAEFADELPPKWATRNFRHRIAKAEYESAANPAKLIPEDQVADAWNRFVTEIGAPDSSRVSSREIHFMRDATYTTARIFWRMPRHESLWLMPAIYAAEPDGSMADGCRALEAIRILHDLGYEPENLQSARKQAQTGILFSEQIRQDRERRQTGGTKGVTAKGVTAKGVIRVQTLSVSPPNPIFEAGTRYFQERGEKAMIHAIEQLLSDALGLENQN